jgi:hypothetical protein
MTGSAGYITVTIGLPDPAQLSAHPSYIRAACAHTGARPRENFAFLKTILDQVKTLHAVSKGENRATFGADEILARDRIRLQWGAGQLAMTAR